MDSLLCLTILFCSFTFRSLQTASLDSVTVSTNFGVVRGKILVTSHGRKVAGFTKIPYAQPPTGKNRFKPPKAAKPWKGTLDATKTPPPCAQLNSGSDDGITGEEDCLYLNVYTPQILVRTNDTQTLFPVLFLIPGGLWEQSSVTSPEIDPDFLLNKDMVLVTLNYRIGALGFFSMGDIRLPGNWGLKDIVFGLKWVQENIKSFGGDNNAITINGNSKGGAAVQILLYNEPIVNRGLFRSAFSSDGVLNNIGSVFPIKNMTIPSKRLADLLGCSDHSPCTVMRCLQKKSFEEIVKNQDKVRLNPVVDPLIVTQWGPVRESPLAEDAVLYFDLDNPSFKPMLPWVQGVGTYSGSAYLSRIFGNKNVMNHLRRSPREILPLLLQLNFKFCQRDIPAVINDIIEYFFGNRPVDRESETQLATLFSCWYYYMGARQGALRYSGPLWFYDNFYNQSVSFVDINPGNVTETPTDPDFLLNMNRNRAQFPNRTFTKQDIENIDKIIDTIYSLMLYGDPSTGSGIQWDRARLPYQLNYLRMADTYTQEPDFYPDCLKFFDTLMTKYPTHGIVEPQNCQNYNSLNVPSVL